MPPSVTVVTLTVVPPVLVMVTAVAPPKELDIIGSSMMALVMSRSLLPLLVTVTILVGAGIGLIGTGPKSTKPMLSVTAPAMPLTERLTTSSGFIGSS